MAKINVESGGAAPLNSGVLQLNNGVAMSSTLTEVTDQANTASPLKLSTTAVQVNSTLQITTDANPYIDAEDGSGNNRFQVGRDPSSQVVNIDFASNPSGGTNLVGGIRTYTDGVNLAQVMTFRKDGNIGIGTTTPGAKLDVHSASNTIVQLNRTGTGNSQIQHLMTGTARWSTGYVNTNGNYSFYDEVNAVFRANLSNTGRLTIGNGDNIGTGQLTVRGSGSTSATTSLLVQNSGGTNTFSVNDIGNTTSSGTLTGTGQVISTGTAGQLALNSNTGTITSTVGYISIQTSGNINLFSPGIGINGDYTIYSYGFIQNDTTINNWNFIGKGGTFTSGTSFSGTSVGNVCISTPNLNTQNGNVTLNHYVVQNTINATAGTTLQRGFYYNPTLTSLVNTNHYGIQTTSGGAYINTATPNASAALQADSTTQGFLPPRMTNAQRAAITTPAVGLMVYCTDAVEGLYIYKSTGWTFVI